MAWKWSVGSYAVFIGCGCICGKAYEQDLQLVSATRCILIIHTTTTLSNGYFGLNYKSYILYSIFEKFIHHGFKIFNKITYDEWQKGFSPTFGVDWILVKTCSVRQAITYHNPN